MTALESRLELTEPGVYSGITAEAYHRDCVRGGSLSSSGARALLPPSCPALFRHEQEHRTEKNHYDIGHAVHTLVLGTGAEFAVIDARDYKSPKTRALRDETYAMGKVPLLEHEHAEVQKMADAVLRHDTAGALLEHGRGHREQVFVWQDPRTGVMCRSMVDSYDEFDGIGPVVIDLKTTKSAEPRAIAKAVEDYGYHQQDPFYGAGYQAVFGVEPAFLFVFVEKTAPYLVTIYQIDEPDRQRGRERNQRALEVYARCRDTGYWPGYSDEIVLGEAPGWAAVQHEHQINAWRREDERATSQTGDAA